MTQHHRWTSTADIPADGTTAPFEPLRESHDPIKALAAQDVAVIMG
jgi:hypothetical protein